MTTDPATPSAFGCTACNDAARRAQAAENATRRLLALADEIQRRNDELRREVAVLEEQIARGRPTLWQAEEVSA